MVTSTSSSSRTTRTRRRSTHRARDGAKARLGANPGGGAPTSSSLGVDDSTKKNARKPERGPGGAHSATSGTNARIARRETASRMFLSSSSSESSSAYSTARRSSSYTSFGRCGVVPIIITIDLGRKISIARALNAASSARLVSSSRLVFARSSRFRQPPGSPRLVVLDPTLVLRRVSVGALNGIFIASSSSVATSIASSSSSSSPSPSSRPRVVVVADRASSSSSTTVITSGTTSRAYNTNDIAARAAVDANVLVFRSPRRPPRNRNMTR